MPYRCTTANTTNATTMSCPTGSSQCVIVQKQRSVLHRIRICVKEQLLRESSWRLILIRYIGRLIVKLLGFTDICQSQSQIQNQSDQFSWDHIILLLSEEHSQNH